MKKLLAVCLAAGILTITFSAVKLTPQARLSRPERLRLLHLRRYVPLNRPEKRTSFPSLMSRL